MYIMENIANYMGYFNFVISVLYAIIIFSIYHYIVKSKKITTYFNNNYSKKNASFYIISLNRLLGFLLFGIIPILILTFQNFDLNNFGFNFNITTDSLYWLIFISVVIILINIYNSKKSDNLAVYPQIRSEEWTLKILVNSALGWVLYIAAYEFLFRGFLLFSCYNLFGFWVAIAINIVIYALVHLPKGKKEILGSIPFGIILCILTLQTSSILTAFLIHLTLALTNEWFSLYYHPKIKLSKNKLI